MVRRRSTAAALFTAIGPTDSGQRLPAVPLAVAVGTSATARRGQSRARPDPIDRHRQTAATVVVCRQCGHPLASPRHAPRSTRRAVGGRPRPAKALGAAGVARTRFCPASPSPATNIRQAARATNHDPTPRPARATHAVVPPPRPLANPAAQKFQLPGTTAWVPAVLSLPGNSQRVQQAVGPERIESQWWEGRWERRDYFRVQTGTGERFWIFQEIGTGRWWLQGDFA